MAYNWMYNEFVNCQHFFFKFIVLECRYKIGHQTMNSIRCHNILFVHFMPHTFSLDAFIQKIWKSCLRKLINSSAPKRRKKQLLNFNLLFSIDIVHGRTVKMQHESEKQTTLIRREHVIVCSTFSLNKFHRFLRFLLCHLECLLKESLAIKIPGIPV